MKTSLELKGYTYYLPPPEVKYRYPAPGSCSMNETDRFWMYKTDWKMPYRTSAFNIQKTYLKYDADDEDGTGKGMSHTLSHEPNLEERAKDPRKGATARALLMHTQPNYKPNRDAQGWNYAHATTH